MGFAKGTANRLLDNASILAKNGDPIQKIVNGLVQTDFRFAASGADQKSGMTAGYSNGEVVVGAAMAIAGPKRETDGVPPDDAVVVRRGTNTAENFANGSGVTVDVNGKLSGASVYSAAGKSEAEVSEGIPNNKVGVTSVGAVRAAGGNVEPKLTRNNPNHCERCGVSAQEASELITVKPNPAKRKDQ